MDEAFQHEYLNRMESSILVEQAEELKFDTSEQRVQRNLEAAEDAYRKGIEDPSRASAFSAAWDRAGSIEARLESLEDRDTSDYRDQVEQIREGVAENGVYPLLRGALRELGINIDSNAVDGTSLDSDEIGSVWEEDLTLAPVHLEQLEDILEYSGRSLEDVPGFDLNEISEAIDEVFYEVADMVDEIPYQVTDPLEDIGLFSELAGIHKESVDIAKQRAEDMITVQNSIGITEHELDEVFGTIKSADEDSDEPEIGFSDAVRGTLERKLENTERRLSEAEEVLEERGVSNDKEEELTERIKDLRERKQNYENLL